jgi:hypothetical protein
MEFTSLKDTIQLIRNRPLPKEILAFFQYKQGNRIFLTLTDKTSVWRDDLSVGERMFADVVVCPVEATPEFQTEIEVTRDVLKQRMKYPGVKENPSLEQIAKTWILPAKLHQGPTTSTFGFSSTEASVRSVLIPLLESLTPGEQQIHLFKVELADGQERPVLYKLLDEGFRPSLVLVKWSHDVDEHIPSAHCAGHLLNSGYACLAYENEYGLYMFNEQVLYDICSLKEPSLKNPIMESLFSTVNDFQKQQKEMVESSVSTVTISVDQPEPVLY